MNYEKRKPMGCEQLTGLTAAVPTAPPTGARGAIITCSGQPVRWRDDGVAPSATVGVYLAIGTILDYQGNLHALQFFQTAATAVVDISYYE